jgi:hypothetical protein
VLDRKENIGGCAVISQIIKSRPFECAFVCSLQDNHNPAIYSWIRIRKLPEEHCLEKMSPAIGFNTTTYHRILLLLRGECCIDDTGHEIAMQTSAGIISPCAVPLASGPTGMGFRTPLQLDGG